MDIGRGREVAEAGRKIAGIMRSLFLALLGISAVALVLVLLGVVDAPGWTLFLEVCVAYFLFMIWREGKNSRLIEVYHKYGELLAPLPDGSVAVRELAGLAQEPEETVVKNLNEMIKRKYLPGFAVELTEGRLVDQRYEPEAQPEG